MLRGNPARMLWNTCWCCQWTGRGTPILGGSAAVIHHAQTLSLTKAPGGVRWSMAQSAARGLRLQLAIRCLIHRRYLCRVAPSRNYLCSRIPCRRVPLSAVSPACSQGTGIGSSSEWRRGRYVSGPETSWIKIKNPAYSQIQGRREQFDKMRQRATSAGKWSRNVSAAHPPLPNSYATTRVCLRRGSPRRGEHPRTRWPSSSTLRANLKQLKHFCWAGYPQKVSRNRRHQLRPGD